MLGVILIFPEGTRSTDRSLRLGKPGAGFLAAKSGVPVIPAYIGGYFDVLPRVGAKMLRRHPVTVYIGKAVNFGDMSGTKVRELYQEMSGRIMEEIAKLKEGSS